MGHPPLTRLNDSIWPPRLVPRRARSKIAVMIAHLVCIFSNLPNDASALQGSISALESEIATLERSSGSPDWWLAGFTLLVAIGVGIEIKVLSHDHAEDMAAWHLCELVPKKPSLRKLVWEIASIVLVIVGILGELGVGLWVSHINGQLRIRTEQLRSKSDQLLTLVTKEAGDANKSAQEAAGASASAKADAKTAKEDVHTVGKRAALIGTELAQAEFLMSARTVRDRDALTGKLKELFKGKVLHVKSYIGDQEAHGLCKQIVSVTRDAEMYPFDDCGESPLTVPLTSPMAVSGPDVDETLKIGDLLNRIGGIGGWSGVKAAELTIFVGVKPPLMIGQAHGVPAPKTAPAKRRKTKP